MHRAHAARERNAHERNRAVLRPGERREAEDGARAAMRARAPRAHVDVYPAQRRGIQGPSAVAVRRDQGRCGLGGIALCRHVVAGPFVCSHHGRLALRLRRSQVETRCSRELVESRNWELGPHGRAEAKLSRRGAASGSLTLSARPRGPILCRVCTADAVGETSPTSSCRRDESTGPRLAGVVRRWRRLRDEIERGSLDRLGQPLRRRRDGHRRVGARGERLAPGETVAVESPGDPAASSRS